MSGIAHGLMVFSGLELMQSTKHRWMGLFSFGLVFIKSITEFVTGQVMFAFLHLGLCGTPLAACHLGGVAGGMLSFFIFNRNRNKRSKAAD